MLEEFTSAFYGYLRTGTVGTLVDFCARDDELPRLGVYRNGFLKACIEALRANYPCIERLVGAARFPALARPYVEAHPPCTACLAEYGTDFARYVRDAREMHGLDYLASFAALDRAWTEVYFSEDGPGGVAPPRSIPDDAEALMNLRGRLSPWVRLVWVDYRVLDVWSRLRRGGCGQRVEIQPAPQRVLIWRSGAETLYRDLTLPEHTFIAGVAAGQPCGEAAGAALEIDQAFDLVTAFASLLHHHMLSFEHRGPAAGVVRRSRQLVESIHTGVQAPNTVWRGSES